MRVHSGSSYAAPRAIYLATCGAPILTTPNILLAPTTFAFTRQAKREMQKIEGIIHQANSIKHIILFMYTFCSLAVNSIYIAFMCSLYLYG